MKNSVIKTMTLLLIAAMLTTAFAACKKPDVPVDNSPAPTEQQAEAQTKVPTEEPSEEPVGEPTEEPTEVPTEAPAPVPTDIPMPEEVDVSKLEPVLKIPLVEITEYDPELHKSCIIRLSVYEEDGDDPFTYEGPADYNVFEGKIYILDAFAHCIKVYDVGSGAWEKNIDVSAAEIDVGSNYGELAYQNGLYYILSKEKNFISIIDENGDCVSRINCPKPFTELWQIDGEVYLSYYGFAHPDGECYDIKNGGIVSCEPPVKFERSEDNEQECIIRHKGHEWIIGTIDSDSEKTGIEFLGSDNYGNAYLFYNYQWIDTNGMFHVESSIRVYDDNSILIRATPFVVSNVGFDIFMLNMIRLKDFDTTYLLVGTKNEMRLYELPFSWGAKSTA